MYMQKDSAYFISMRKFTEVKWLPMVGDTNFIVSIRLKRTFRKSMFLVVFFNRDATAQLGYFANSFIKLL